MIIFNSKIPLNFQKIIAVVLIISFAGFLLLFPPQKVFAATGDITAVRITNDARGEGWVAEIDISGLSTGGTYNFNLGTNNATTTNTPYFTVTSQGYDDSGNATTITRTVYATNYERNIYPSDATANETAGAGYVTVRVALSDWIYSSDTLTFTAPAAFYTQGSGNNTVSGLSVTNSSAESYPKVIANWSWPGYDRITGSTFKLRAVAFHRSAQQGRPVKAVKYTCTDQHSNTVTTTVTSPSIDGTISDAVPVVEYVGTLSATTLTQGDTLTCNFIAYPWYGDSNSVLNTGDGVNTMPTPLYAPQYYLVDTSNTYGVTVAVVDSVSGNNGTGVAIDYASFDSQNPPAAFLNIFAAANAIAAYNNTNHGGRNNTGAGIIYLKEGSHVWTGGTVTAGGQATAVPWTTVTKFPGTTRANVLISSASNTKQVGEHLKIEDVKITNSTTIGFTGMDAVWVHNSDIAPTGAGTFYINTVNYFTNSQIYNNAELIVYSTVNASRALIRGNTTATTLTTGAKPYVFIGNNFAFSGAAGVGDNYTGQTTPTISNAIYAFNILSQSSATAPIIGQLSSSIANATGTAIVQNILERVSGTSPPIMQVAADTSTSDPVNNILIWNNTLIGQRLNMGYNDGNLNNIGPVYRKSWSVKNNIFDDYNSVTDIDAHGYTPNASRYGNHSVIHGVGQSGNIILNRVGTESYENKFGGLYYKRGSPLDPAFTNDNSAATDSTGNGDYHLTASSPALNLTSSGQALLLYDIAGSLRHNNGFGAAGAYEFLTATKAITTFDFNALSPAVIGTITEGNHTIALTVPYGTDVTALVPTITITGASVSPASGVAQNFTSPVTYTVTAEDGTTQAYTATVTIAADTTAPTVSSYSPADNATGVAINSDLVLTFSKNMAKGTGNILIKNTVGDATVQTIDVTSGAVSITNNTVTINPTDFSWNGSYYVIIASGVLVDTVTPTPNAYAGISDKTTWNFDTVVDTTGPTGTISNGNGTPTNSVTPTLNLTIADAGIGITGAQMQFSCNNSTWSSWEAYATPKTNFNVRTGEGCTDADGSKTVYVKYKDSLGNIGSAYNTGAFTLDTTSSIATLSNTPTSLTNSTTASITIAGTDIVSYKYKLDSGSYGVETVIATPISLSGLADGSHTISVIGKDSAGNWQAEGSATIYTWTVDTTVPDTTIDSYPPDSTNSTEATFTFSSDDETATFSCSLDSDSSYSACADSKNYTNLSEGSHTFYVKATDAATNEDPTPASYSWTIDTTGPDTTIDSHPDSSTASTSATFTFSSDDETAIFQCKLDATDYTICASPQDFNSLALGNHNFSVKAIDTEDNEDPSPATFSWTITEIPALPNNDGNTDNNTGNKKDLNVHSVKAESTENTITITWKTDYNTKSTIKYGASKNLKEKMKDGDSEKKHKAILKDLLSNTKYYFRINATDGDDNEDSSSIHLIVTKSAPTPSPISNPNSGQSANENTNQASTENTTAPTYSGNANPDTCAYTVESGDTLWSIAKKIYGDATAYPAIIEKNKDKYPDISSKLSIGQELTFCDNNQNSQTTGNNSNIDNSLPTGQAGSQPSQNQTQQQPETKTFHWWNPFSWF